MNINLTIYCFPPHWILSLFLIFNVDETKIVPYFPYVFIIVWFYIIIL